MAPFDIRRARSADVDAAVAALAEAFAEDPLMGCFFAEHPGGVRGGTAAFFSILLRVRLELEMPAYVLQQGDEILGAVMGYDTSRPAWPASLTDEWGRLESATPRFSGRLAAYEQICDAHEPDEAHHYLGVIGVHPSLQGVGAGKALLNAFCELSRDAPTSQGVYLDTSNPSSLEFYLRNGFELRGVGRLDEVDLWCVYRGT